MFIKDTACVRVTVLSIHTPASSLWDRLVRRSREGKGAGRKQASKQERAITEMESMPEGGERGWKKGTGRNLRGRL